MAKLPSKSMKVLRDIVEGRGAYHDCHGMPQHGGRAIILHGLYNRGLIDRRYENGTIDGNALVNGEDTTIQAVLFEDAK
jgi:hypothetical protein